MKKIILTLIFITTLSVGITTASTVYAAPYGKGKYSNLPYGSQTTLSIATNGNVTIPITSVSDSGTQATGTSNVTVTSTDITGYKLYVRALSSSSMDNAGTSLPASANGSPAALAVNTWGYNTNASSNFVGLTLSDALVRSVTSPVPSGDTTTFTYGVKIDRSKRSGTYTATVLYTAVPQTD